jgi:hypothetical protein
MYNFKCPYCGASLETNDAYIGKCINCFSCSEVVVVPDRILPVGTEFAGCTIQELVCANMFWTTYHALGVTKSFGRNFLLRIPTVFIRSQPGELYKNFVATIRMSGGLGIDDFPEVIENNVENDIPYFLFDSHPSGTVLSIINVAATFKSPYECLAMVRKLAVALKKLWEKHNLVVQTLKPSNICYYKDEAKSHVLDVGISQFALSAPELLEYGLDIWDQSYVAPELIETGTADTPASDIYSLGQILYFLLTGADPEEGEDIANYNTSVPDEITALYRAMTKNNLEDRIADYKILLRRIDEIKANDTSDDPLASSYHETSTMAFSMSNLKDELNPAAAGPKFDLGSNDDELEDEEQEEVEEIEEEKKSKLPIIIIGIVILLAVVGAVFFLK